MEKLGMDKYIVWFYSAMFIDILPRLNASLVVYDCMDELSAFKGAPPQLISKEKQLLTIADVTFTGGKSLFESKKKIADNVYCFPSSVDQKHFEKSLKKDTEIPEDIKHLDKPVVGFYGVIDERIDLELLENIAKAMPEVSFVMIGPVVKINENDLPKQKNIHYLGGKKYQELPAYLKGIDIAMMPFALNESTKFISPTKTLEFMAAYKPIISTPIYDVVRDYKNEVAIVKNTEEFVEAIKKYMNETKAQKTKRVALMKAVLKRTSWDNTVDQMENIMQEKAERVAVTDKIAKAELPVINQFTIKNLKVAYE
jgi:glycosyltransferase involved in cell wall biosynthesis